MDEIGLIVGLGNPGPEYAGTRHNAGFMVIDRLLAGFPAGRFEERHTASSSVWAGKFRGRALLLQKPLTFMNLSGQAVALLARRSGIQRNGGADGGHNGLKSIIAELGSSSFRRLRIGIGRPKPGETVDYVLSKFEGEEERRFEASLAAAAEAVRTVLTGGMARAMNRFNAWTPVEESETNQKKEVLS